MASSKKTTETAKPKTGHTANEASAGTTAQDDNISKVNFDRVKDALPDMGAVAADATEYLKDHTNVDIQRLADDATTFVRRNPAASLAAAAGLGLLVGVLATKRS